jgi:hypothetical protein
MNIKEPPAKSIRFFEVYKSTTLTGNPVKLFNIGFRNHKRKTETTKEISISRIVSNMNCIIRLNRETPSIFFMLTSFDLAKAFAIVRLMKLIAASRRMKIETAISILLYNRFPCFVTTSFSTSGE